MQTEPQISYRGVEASSLMNSLIDKKIAGLERSFQRITSCHVTVEKRDKRGQKGHLFKVAVELEVPGGVIIVNHKPGDLHAHEDVRVAIRDSFKAARRQLEEHAQKIAGVHVKSHPEKHFGQVVRLFAAEGYGFLETPAGVEVYFQRDSVVRDDWEKLDTGSDVEFSLMDGEKGPFAVNVSVRTQR